MKAAALVYDPVDRLIVRLEARIAAEDASLASMVAERHVPPGAWKRRHDLALRLSTARALRQAIAEVAGDG